MSLLEKIPQLDDASLKNLLENARRLEASGSVKQKADAAELLPALGGDARLLKSIEIVRPSLESVYLTVTGRLYAADPVEVSA